MKTKPSQLVTYIDSKHLPRVQQKGIPQQLHKYIWGVTAIFSLFVASFPVAYIRVAQNQKFDRQPLNSISWSENQKDNSLYPEKK